MKIYAIADLHGDLKQLDIIKSKSKHVDLFVFAGDMTIFGQDIKRILSKINKLGKTSIIIHGNHEDAKEVKDLCKNYKHLVYIHNKYFVFNDVLFLGHGGGGFSTRNKSFDKTSPRFLKLAKEFNKVVFVIHQPPYNTKCDIIHGEKTGNKSYRDFIRKAQPDIVICGHIHENEGKKDKIRKSIIVNPGWKGKILRV